jgi:hypothetical protein
MYQSSGSNTLFEYACDEHSAIGDVVMKSVLKASGYPGI